MRMTASSCGHRRRRTASTTAMGNQRGLRMRAFERPSGACGPASTRQELFAPAHLLETLEELGTIHRHHESTGATPKDRGAGHGGLSSPTHRRLRRAGPGGERATGGAIGACSVGHRGERGRTRSFGDDGRCDTRDGRGCTQRTAPGEGPRIPRRAMKSGERRRSAKRNEHAALDVPWSLLPGRRERHSGSQDPMFPPNTIRLCVKAVARSALLGL